MKLQLSISLLVSNRLSTVRKCLDSILPILKAIPSELIIVFTGTEEEVLDVAREYTEQIVPFTWCDDFSKARNAGLNKAKGQWFMFLDDDEWFEDVSEIIRFFQSGEYKTYEGAYHIIRNYVDKKGETYVASHNYRLVKLNPEVKFVSSIHEYINYVGSKVKYLNDYSHHYGYVEVKDTLSKYDRNVPLLKHEIAKDPNAIRNYVHLAQEYSSSKEWKKAEETCRRGLSLNKKYWNQTCLNWILVMLPKFIKDQGDTKKATEECVYLLEKYKPLELPSCFLFARLIEFNNILNNSSQVMHYIPLFHNTLKQLEANPMLGITQQVIAVTSNVLEEQKYTVYLIGIIHAIKLKEFDKCLELLSDMPWNTDLMQDGFYASIQGCKNGNIEDLDTIIHLLATLDNEDNYILFHKALDAEINENKKDMEYYYKSIDTASIHAVLYPEIVLFSLRNQLPLYDTILELDSEDWDACVSRIYNNTSLSECRTIIDNSIQAIKPIDIVKHIILERKLLEWLLTKEELEGDVFYESLLQYCNLGLEYYDLIYKDNLFDDNRKYLPKSMRFNLLLNDVIISFSQKDYRSCLNLLKNSVKIYPVMSEAIKRFLNRINEELESSKTPVNEEFVLLGTKVKAEIRKLLGTHSYKEASIYLGKLIPLLPDDLELVKLKMEIDAGLNGLDN